MDIKCKKKDQLLFEAEERIAKSKQKYSFSGNTYDKYYNSNISQSDNKSNIDHHQNY